MSLNPPEAGLRRLHNRSKQTAKVTIHVAPGDELAVSDDVAAQLVAGDRNAFALPDAETPPADDGHEGTGDEVEMVSADLADKLRADAEELGIKVDKRWGAARLQSEIDAKLQG